jgi:hypothetical protein
MRTLVPMLILGSCLVVACGDGSSDGQQGMDGMAEPNPVTATEPSMMPGSPMMSTPSPMMAAPMMLQRKGSQAR